MSYEDTQELIYKYIKEDRPFSLIRPGLAEIKMAADWEERDLFGHYLYQRRGGKKSLETVDGRTYKHLEMFKRSIQNSDVLACFRNDVMEEYFVDRYFSDGDVIDSNYVFPLKAKRPWTEALKGKNVVVVSVFADYLQQQYDRREELYGGKWQFPEMKLIPVKSVWLYEKTADYWDYYSALDYLFNKIEEQDYDIALLSCGPLAIDLAPMIKKAGKQAIHLAGEMQLMFGIKGERWDSNDTIYPYYNEAWIRVSKEESGISDKNSMQMDGGKCYW